MAKRTPTSFTISTDSSFNSLDDSPPTSPEDSDVEPEARTFYHGLPSRPRLIFRTGAPPEKLTGPEAYIVKREIRPVFDEELATVWEDMGTEIYKYLDSVRIRWTTIDVVRFAEPGKPADGIVIWIGVMPRTLSRKNAQVAALACEQILNRFKIIGVEIAFRESLFRRSSPKLLNYVATANPTASVGSPLTTALGLPIASTATRYAEGTGGLYLRVNDKICILTARHVVFPPKNVQNRLYHREQNTQRRVCVMVPGPQAFQDVLTSIMVKIAEENIMVSQYKEQLDRLRKREESGNTDGIELERMMSETSLKVAQASIGILDQFHTDVTKFWSQEEQRIIGHVIYAPPIGVGVGAKRYTEDWALIEFDHGKLDLANFRGNVIDLGTEISPGKFTSMMYPDQTAPSLFKYPHDRLFPVRDVVPEDELFHPQMRDADGEPCIFMIKNGRTTNTTIGRGNGIKSFVRDYFMDDAGQTSMEFAILGYDKSRSFSEEGDSGAIIIDAKGRVAALLTGGSGLTKATDITYATPFEWLLERIRAKFPNAHLYPSTS